MSKATPQATVVITTRNRKDDLRRALNSVFAQTVPVEVIVTDDASEDGTPDLVGSEFPDARLLRSEICLGLIAQRNRAAREASTEFIFSLDDDAEFGAEDTVERTLRDFDHPRVSAVAVPHVDTQTHLGGNAPAPDDQLWCVASFTGTAYALKRSVFLGIGGFREDLVHQGEEGDYCLRLMDGGHVVRLGRASEIQHHESPRRSFDRMDYYGRRNALLFAWRYTPLGWLLPHLAATSVNGVLQSIRTRRFLKPLKGMLAAYCSILLGKSPRQPVSCGVYHLFRSLKKGGAQTLSTFESQLPALQQFPATHH